MIFHLAIPSRDIKESIEFYKKLGCKVGRKSDDFAILNFNEHQVVLHKVDSIEEDPKMYPRHFGAVLTEWNNFLAAYGLCKIQKLEFFEDWFVRYENKQEEHHTFFLKDPSNNLIEFKWYKNRGAIF